MNGRATGKGTLLRTALAAAMLWVLALAPWGNTATTTGAAAQVNNRGGTKQDHPPNELQLQFTTGGHITAFRPDGAWLAGADHMLSVSFLGARSVVPKSTSATTAGGEAAPLEQVIYRRLWPGIDLTYESAPGGIVKSSYSLSPGADVDRIRLEYNRTPQIGGQGELRFTFETGEMVEAAPIAWQVIDGVRVPVQAAFQSLGEKQIGFTLGAYDPTYELIIDPPLHWTTFMGDHISDKAFAVACSTQDNYTFIIGTSEAAWGSSPVRSYSAKEDAFVAKLDTNGDLVWHAFLGGSGDDEGKGIVYSTEGALYVIGESSKSWGSDPDSDFTGGYDIFVAKLSTTNGIIEWHTFLGSNDDDFGRGIAIASGYLYITGYSGSTWGSNPISGHSGGYDILVAEIYRSTGGLDWHTFIGGSGFDRGMALASDGSQVYVAGYSSSTWGSPHRLYTAGSDGVLFALDTDGSFIWNTFLGSSSSDYLYDVTLDSSGTVYVIGNSGAAWVGGAPPIRAYTGGSDAFVAKFLNTGLMLWNTFLGSSGTERGYGITVYSNSHIYVTGYGNASWGNPAKPYSGDNDIFSAQLDAGGDLLWNSFHGSATSDKGNDIALNSSNLPQIVGTSNGSWGDPERASAGYDAVAARLDTGGHVLWNTFLGAASEDAGESVALGPDGDIYVAGYSTGSWGISPRSAHEDGIDAFVARYNLFGQRIWHTFIGGDGDDKALGLVVSSAGDIYVTGESSKSWGSPIRGFTGAKDAFVARLNSNGLTQWNTFLGGANNDIGYAIAKLGAGNLHITGASYATWGTTPVLPYISGSDAFAAEMEINGDLVWHTFLGGSGADSGRGLVTDISGNVYIAGTSSAHWGSPISSHSGTGVYNAVIIKLNTNGGLVWHTFMGGVHETGAGIARDGLGNIYVTGSSYQGWGFPIRPCTANFDAFVLKLNSLGTLQWNTCLGVNDGATPDFGYAIAADSAGNTYVTGVSSGIWGTPLPPYSGGGDAFIAKLSNAGALQWNGFQGSPQSDDGRGIAYNESMNTLYVTGQAYGQFGSALNPSHGEDAFLLRMGDWFVSLPLILK